MTLPSPIPFVIAAVILAFVYGCLPQPAYSQERVDVALVLAIDVSASIDGDRYELQQNSIADTFKDQDILDAIRMNPYRQIAVTVNYWSGPEEQKTMVPWMLIRDRSDGERFSAMLRGVPRVFNGVTAVGDAMGYSVVQIENCPYIYDRAVIDISGDGKSNSGKSVELSRDWARELSVTVNGLAIVTDAEPDLEEWYYMNVPVGEDAFVMVVKSFEDFRVGIRFKIIREIS